MLGDEIFPISPTLASSLIGLVHFTNVTIVFGYRVLSAIVLIMYVYLENILIQVYVEYVLLAE